MLNELSVSISYQYYYINQFILLLRETIKGEHTVQR